MLEKYFKKGAMFSWNRPSSVQVPLDGQVVDKTRRTTPMTFIGTARELGLSQHVDPVLTPQYLQQHGLTPGAQIRYRWLDYQPGRTARVRNGRRNILTGPMSGCPITRWQQGGIHYVGHVGTLLGMPRENALVKGGFQAVAPPNATGFNPAGEWQPNDTTQFTGGGTPFGAGEILAYVTSRGHFYTTIFLGVGGRMDRRFCVGSKRVQPLMGGALNALLG